MKLTEVIQNTHEENPLIKQKNVEHQTVSMDFSITFWHTNSNYILRFKQPKAIFKYINWAT